MALIEGGFMTTGTHHMPQSAVSALEEGNLIAAIRHVRAATGLGLKASKELVQSHLSQDALLQARYRAARPTPSGLGLLTIAILIMAAWLIYHHLMGGR